jgi:hypothetical protein
MNCNWDTEINQSLACFLHDPQPGPGGWNWIGWAGLLGFLVVGWLLERRGH